MSRIIHIDERYNHLIPIKDDAWFNIFQKPLLSLANTDYGRDLLSIDKGLPPIVDFGKHWITGLQDVKDGYPEYITELHSGMPWGNIIRERWAYVSKALKPFYQEERHGATFYKPVLFVEGVWRAAAATTTMRPDPHPETDTCDGHASRANVNESWASKQGGNGNQANAAGATLPLTHQTAASTDEWRTLRRLGIFVDSSPIPDVDTISSATLEFTASARADTFTNSIAIAGFTSTSNTDIVASDYQSNNSGLTRFSDADLAWSAVTIDSSTFNVITLNATGIANLSKTGVDKFGLYVDYDFDDSPPAWQSGVVDQLTILAAETADVTADPKVVAIHNGTVIKDIIGLGGVVPFAR